MAMVAVAKSGASVGIPWSLHALLWPGLIIWLTLLLRGRSRRPWLRSSRLGFGLAAASVLADLATVAASRIWVTSASSSFVFALLWLTILLSVSAYLVLRARDDREEGGSGEEAPEPPWWPDFERQFRDYAGGRPRPSSLPPRTPLGTA
jgi:hypothetical protein